MPFLPMTRVEMDTLGWQEADIILISGDAYVDHPSFGIAIIGRSLEASGYKVAILAQPDINKDTDFLALGKPRLCFGISAGNMDSMVNHYTAQRKIRSDDAYTPGGIAGKRPDRATIIYTNKIKQLFKGIPIIIGGIEASLRRIAHYDYWSDTVKNSILADSKADILVYGMAEQTIVRIADYLNGGNSIKELKDLPGTVVFDNPHPETGKQLILPKAADCKDKQIYHEAFRSFYENFQDQILFQENGGRFLRHNSPAPPLSEQEMDRIYALDFENAPHPSYKLLEIPAWEQIKDSLTSHRGCYGGCNFCAITAHQGRAIQSRSAESLVNEATRLTRKHRSNLPGATYRFHGTISDVGGPTANMWQSKCKLGYPEACKRRSCIFPNICPNLQFDHQKQLEMLDRVSAVEGVNHVFISSGIRHDLAIKDTRYIAALAKRYTGGRLKLAPEHSSDRILRLMGKPSISSYEKFCVEFEEQCCKAGLKRQVIPYLIIGHPGTTIEEAKQLASWLRLNKIQVEQVQEFTPTPLTISTCMYYTGLDFETGKPIHIPKGREIREQKELIFWWKRGGRP